MKQLLPSFRQTLWVLLALLFIGGLTAKAQIAWETINTLNTSSGLPSDEIISVRFSRNGKLWVSTNLAFASYDGSTWKVYSEKDGLPANGVRWGKIYEDSRGNMWICSEENGLAQVTPEGQVTLMQAQEEVEQGLVDNGVFDVVEDGKGGYFISNWKQYATSLSYLSAEGKWTHYPFSAVGFNPFDKILCMAYDKEHNVLYAGTLFSGVMYFNAEEEAFYPVSEDYQTSVSELAISSDGKLYAAMDIGLMKLDLTTKKVIKVMTEEQGLANNFILSVAVDARGNVWAGTDGSGITCIAPDGALTQYNTSNGLSANDIYSIAFDKNQRAYVGTRIGGISYQDGEGNWKHIGSMGLAGNDVSSVIFASDEATWFATSAGLSLYNGKLWKNFKLTREDGSGLLKDVVSGMVWDNRPDRNALYVSGYGGIAKYEPKGDQWTFFPCVVKNEKGEEQRPRMKVMQDREGGLWVTTYGERLGIGRFDEETKTYTFLNDRNLPEIPSGNHAFFTAVQAPDGAIWFCSVGGVLIYKDEKYTFKKFPISIQIPDPETGEMQSGWDHNVRNVAFDSEGRAWLSKLSGVVIYDPKTETKTEEKGLENLPLSVVTKIVFDAEGNAFVGTFFDGLFLRTAQGQYYHLAEPFGLDSKLQVTEIYLHNDRLYLCTDRGVMSTANYRALIAQAVGNESVENLHEGVYIYPNPAQDRMVLPNHTSSYYLYDLSGRLLLEGDARLHNTVSLEGTIPGIYLVRYMQQGRWRAEKLVIR